MYETFLTVGDNPAQVLYTSDLDGGGTWFGQDYIEVLKNRYPDRTFPKCYEWCSGPGFIGYAILANGLSETICFTDIHDPAILATEQSAKVNGWEDRVTAYLLKDLALLPSYERFDLVVSNPPHFQKTVSYDSNRNRLCTDLGWQAHKNFYKNIKQHLTNDGIILIQENVKQSTIDDFKDFIDTAGLEITDSFPSQNFENIYYIEVQHKK